MADNQTTTIEAPEPPKHLNPLGNWMQSVVSTLPNPSIAGKETNEPTADKPAGTGDAVPDPAPPPAPDSKAGSDVAELPEDKWPRSAHEWKKFREARKKQVEERDSEIKTLKTQLTELQAKVVSPTTDPKEVESLKKERDELSEQLKLAYVERHPKFKTYFESKTNAQIELAKRIVGPDNQPALLEAINLPEGQYRDSKIEEIFLSLSPVAQSRLGDVLNSLAEIDAEKQREIQNARTNYDQLQSQEKARVEKARADFDKAVADTLSQVQDPQKGLPQWQKREGDADWNAGVDQRMSLAKKLLTEKITDPRIVINAALDAVSMPAVLKDNLALREHIKKLEAQVNAFKSANPAPAGERTTQEPEGRMPQPKPGTRPMDVTQGWVKGLQAARGS